MNWCKMIQKKKCVLSDFIDKYFKKNYIDIQTIEKKN